MTEVILRGIYKVHCSLSFKNIPKFTDAKIHVIGFK